MSLLVMKMSIVKIKLANPVEAASNSDSEYYYPES